MWLQSHSWWSRPEKRWIFSCIIDHITHLWLIIVDSITYVSHSTTMEDPHMGLVCAWIFTHDVKRHLRESTLLCVGADVCMVCVLWLDWTVAHGGPLPSFTVILAPSKCMQPLRWLIAKWAIFGTSLPLNLYFSETVSANFFYYPGQKNWDRHPRQTAGACMLERSRTCARWRVAVSIFLARVLVSMEMCARARPFQRGSIILLDRLEAELRCSKADPKSSIRSIGTVL